MGLGFLKFKYCLGRTSISLTRTKRKQLQSHDDDEVDDGHVRTAGAAKAISTSTSSTKYSTRGAIASGINSSSCSKDEDVMIRKFSWDEIERLTMNMCRARVIGSGGFSNVYLIDLGHQLGQAAVKIINGTRLFKQELDILRHLHHHNIVNLIGYCDDRDDVGALVLEYVSNGSLQEKLHGEGQAVIPWKKRMAIAVQLAEALQYLHHKCGSTTLPIVHGDIKASNLLLDQNLNLKLCDFGSAKMGFSSTVADNRRPMVLMGSPGYTDPHYLKTGIPSKKNDVYSFGVLLLELVTGMEAYSSERPPPTQLLTSLVGLVGPTADHTSPILVDPDPRLVGDFDPEEARAMISLSAQCLRHPPTLRPSSTQILETINNHISYISVSDFVVFSHGRHPIPKCEKKPINPHSTPRL
ncbi:Serine/threonine protein kinase [Parasponia andersonii]|uniref:Serine/threonine protein kinase n=1 Tax=Parasponia andersonii TaxID=3476 RepID=A0A2P5AVU7_PARAD|nr:Serine/threonine protein kinase [Parasponia andersonii]